MEGLSKNDKGLMGMDTSEVITGVGMGIKGLNSNVKNNKTLK